MTLNTLFELHNAFQEQGLHSLAEDGAYVCHAIDCRLVAEAVIVLATTRTGANFFIGVATLGMASALETYSSNNDQSHASKR